MYRKFDVLVLVLTLLATTTLAIPVAGNAPFRGRLTTYYEIPFTDKAIGIARLPWARIENKQRQKLGLPEFTKEQQKDNGRPQDILYPPIKTWNPFSDKKLNPIIPPTSDKFLYPFDKSEVVYEPTTFWNDPSLTHAIKTLFTGPEKSTKPAERTWYEKLPIIGKPASPEERLAKEKKDKEKAAQKEVQLKANQQRTDVKPQKNEPKKNDPKKEAQKKENNPPKTETGTKNGAQTQESQRKQNGKKQQEETKKRKAESKKKEEKKNQDKKKANPHGRPKVEIEPIIWDKYYGGEKGVGKVQYNPNVMTNRV